MGFISPVATDANGEAVATGSMQELGKDDFLQLMVTKLQYQDPLNPMEDADFIAQLAEFSSLEQMNNIANVIDESNELDVLQMQSLNNMMATDLVGKEIEASYDGVYLDEGSSPQITFTTDEYATQVDLYVYDESGAVINVLRVEDVPAGVNSTLWNGNDSLGYRSAEGYYAIEAVAKNAAGNTFTPSLSLIGTVDSITYRDGAAYLNVGKLEISLSDVVAVGTPGSLGEDDG